MGRGLDRRDPSEWLYGPGSMTWRVNREGVLLLGARAALLMQLAHPKVAAAVSDHSKYRSDPIGRLRGTLEPMLTIVFGDVGTAKKAAGRINRMHARVTGECEAGHYDATDPRLLLWVHSTLVDSSLRVYEACVAPLGEAERERYYAESTDTARLFMVPERMIPPDLSSLRCWMGRMIGSGEVAVTDTAREAARPILRPLPVVPMWVAEATALITTALLPPPIRDGYGLKIGGPRSALLAAGGRASRALLPRMPPRVRQWPAARAASKGRVA